MACSSMYHKEQSWTYPDDVGDMRHKMDGQCSDRSETRCVPEWWLVLEREGRWEDQEEFCEDWEEVWSYAGQLCFESSCQLAVFYCKNK